MASAAWRRVLLALAAAGACVCALVVLSASSPWSLVSLPRSPGLLLLPVPVLSLR
jgi:hypothetical protein